MESVKTKCPFCNYDFEAKIYSSPGVDKYYLNCQSCKEKFVIDINGVTQKSAIDYTLPPPEEDERFGPPIQKKGTSYDVGLPPPDYYDESQPPWVPQKKEKSNLLPVAGMMLIVTFLLGIIFGSLLLVMGEDLYEQGFGRDGIVSGKVNDEDGNPLNGARVEIVDTSIFVNTDASGKYYLNNVPGGYQEIKASYPNKTSISTSVLMVGTEETIDFILTNGTSEKKTKESVNSDIFNTTILVCGIVMIIGSIFALVGAIFAFTKKNYQMAFLGSMIGIASIGFFIGAIFSIIAMIMIWKSKDHFN